MLDGTLSPADRRVGQALAGVATISLLHERSMRRSDILNEPLQTALNSRVIIEQAKGKLAERLGSCWKGQRQFASHGYRATTVQGVAEASRRYSSP